MKTFDEYANEARQSYIFGGTDNRNTNVYDNIKTFKELEVGDYILYFSSRTLKTPIRIRIDDIKVFSNRVECKCKFDKDYDAAYTIYATDSQYHESREYPGYYFNAYGTNEELFIETLKEDHGLDFSVSDIEDRVVEANQNYIFGGTDNRAPKVEKTFDELEKGDVFYLWADTDDESFECTLTADPYTEKNDEGVLYLEVEYNKHYVWLKDANETYSYCDSEMMDSIWVVATSFEELYDVVEEKFGVKIDKNKIEKE